MRLGNPCSSARLGIYQFVLITTVITDALFFPRGPRQDPRGSPPGPARGDVAGLVPVEHQASAAAVEHQLPRLDRAGLAEGNPRECRADRLRSRLARRWGIRRRNGRGFGQGPGRRRRRD
jgi:hypothetical protein